MHTEHYFTTPVYFEKKETWVNILNNYTDDILNEVKKNNDLKVYHSGDLSKLNQFEFFNNFILEKSYEILNSQGYDLTNYNLFISEEWVQEFSEKGYGNHSLHTHWNGHISGFYFLKCSDKTSYPVFQDPRPGKIMIQLPEKDNTKVNFSSERVHIKIEPGLFVFFNSYLPHEYVVDEGKEPFRFIHFNIQAFPKNILALT